MSFKVGDKVRVTNAWPLEDPDTQDEGDLAYRDSIGTVDIVDQEIEGLTFFVSFDDSDLECTWFYRDELEAVE